MKLEDAFRILRARSNKLRDHNPFACPDNLLKQYNDGWLTAKPFCISFMWMGPDQDKVRIDRLFFDATGEQITIEEYEEVLVHQRGYLLKSTA